MSAKNVPAERAGTGIQKSARADIRSYLVGSTFEAEVGKLVGDLNIAKRFARVCLTQVNADEKLLACSVQSLAGCLMELAEVGLEPGRDAYLIPRGKLCTVTIKWQGYVRAARASGEIKRVWSDVIREGDTYTISGGSDVPHVEHSWSLTEKRGDIIGAYACAEWSDGVVETLVVDRDYLDRCAASSDMKSGGPWKKWRDQMSKKVVTKRLCEGLPLGNSDKLSAVSAIDNSEQEDVTIIEQPIEMSRTEELREKIQAKLEARPAPKPHELDEPPAELFEEDDPQ